MRPLSDAKETEFSNIKYVLTDIDDTLTYNGRLSARTYSALERLHFEGIKIVPVTAAPAGWCDLMVRMWPIDAIIGENGGFYTIKRNERVDRVFWMPDRIDVTQRLLSLEQKIKNTIPSAKIASDQPFRLTNIAWNRPADKITTHGITEALFQSGARATTNSIWVLGWFGDYDKLAMARRLMHEVYGVDIDAGRNEFVYVGDSTNDEPMFRHFPNSAGVSTVVKCLSQLEKLPTWVTVGPGGNGFVEVADAIIASLRGGS